MQLTRTPIRKSMRTGSVSLKSIVSSSSLDLNLHFLLTAWIYYLSKLAFICQIVRVCSSKLEEANLVGLFSEASSADHDAVLSDEAGGGLADSALAGVLSVLSRVGVQLVRHVSRCGLKQVNYLGLASPNIN